MNAEQRKAITDNFVYLSDNLTCDENFLSHLLQNRILSEANIDTLLSIKTKKKRNVDFFMLIQKKGSNAFAKLCDALIETLQRHIAEKINPQLVTIEEDRPIPQGEPEEVDQPPRNDDESFSDSLEYLDENREDLVFISPSLKLRTCKGDISALTAKFYDEKRNYVMSCAVRGQAIIINNEEFFHPLPNRPGTKFDSMNISKVLQDLKFKVEKVHENIDSKGILGLLDEAKKSGGHKNYGMFVLVIMSHGNEKAVYGKDSVPVPLSLIYESLNSKNFPDMAGKPKLIIIQACSGDRVDNKSLSANFPNCALAHAGDQTSESSLDDYYGPGGDDFYIMKASFLGFASTRHEKHGSWFIRALVEALYKHSWWADIDQIFQQTKKKVTQKSIQTRELYPNSQNIGAQTPLSFNYLQGHKKLFLYPGFDPQVKD